MAFVFIFILFIRLEKLGENSFNRDEYSGYYYHFGKYDVTICPFDKNRQRWTGLNKIALPNIWPE